MSVLYMSQNILLLIVLLIILMAEVFLIIYFLQKIKKLQNFNAVLQKKNKANISNSRKINKTLKDEIGAKNEFISIVAHELRTPLTVIKGYLSMLYENAFGELSEKQNLAVVKAYRGNEDLINMVENLLNFSRIQDGRIKYNFNKVYLDEIVKTVLEQFEIQIKSKKLKINIKNQPANLPYAMGDFNKLKSVIANLLDNAIKYNKDESKIDINITVNKKDMIFKITDNGVGMVPADAARLFEKFSQNKEMSFKRAQGAGLGLYIIEHFISAHKGKVWASSPGRGKGMTFGFSLPRK